MSTFYQELRQLRKTIVRSWLVNFALVAGTLFAAMIVIFVPKNTTTEDAVPRLVAFAVIAIVVAAVLLWIVSARSSSVAKKFSGGDFREQKSGKLFNIVEEIAISAGITPPKVYIAYNTGTANAFAVANNREAHVVVTNELLHMLNREELSGVLAHEMGHILGKDCQSMTKIVAMTSITGFVSELALRFFGGRNGSRNSKNPIMTIILVCAFIFLLFAPLLSKLAESSMSRTRESQADMFSVQLTRDPLALAGALRKISEQPYDEAETRLYRTVGQLAIASPETMGKKFATHPPIEERIAKLERMAEGR